MNTYQSHEELIADLKRDLGRLIQDVRFQPYGHWRVPQSPVEGIGDLEHLLLRVSKVIAGHGASITPDPPTSADVSQQNNFEDVANDLRRWIDETSKSLGIAASDLSPVYSAHVLLCELIRQAADVPLPAAPEDTYIDVVFDGPPDHEAGRFVEVEHPAGRSIRIGQWINRGDGTWALRVTSAELGALALRREGGTLTHQRTGDEDQA